MSKKERMKWCEPGKSFHPDCPEGYVFLCSVAEVDEAYGLGYETAKCFGSYVYDNQGVWIPDRKAVFVSKKEWEMKKTKS